MNLRPFYFPLEGLAYFFLAPQYILDTLIEIFIIKIRVSMKQSKYSDEEKLKIVAVAISSENISATAKHYNISDVTIHTWTKKFNKNKPA